MATWTIPMTEYSTTDNEIIIAHWRVTEEETVGTGDDAVTYTASSYGTCSFTPQEIRSDFVPYVEVTESMVLGWCWENGVDKEAIEASLVANIEDQKNPVTASGVPW